jgi:hypothetical protein
LTTEPPSCDRRFSRAKWTRDGGQGPIRNLKQTVMISLSCPCQSFHNT